MVGLQVLQAWDVLSGLVTEAMWAVDALTGAGTGAPLDSSGALSAAMGSDSGHALCAIEERFRQRIQMCGSPDDRVPACLAAVLQSADTFHSSTSLTVRPYDAELISLSKEKCRQSMPRKFKLMPATCVSQRATCSYHKERWTEC